MQDMSRALNEVKGIFHKVTGQPAPEIGPQSYAPFPPGVDPMAYTFQEVDHLKRISEALLTTPPRWVPRADSFLTDDAFVVRVEVPGVTRDDLKVFFSMGECVIRGERKAAEGRDGIRPLAVERPWGPFERRFALPPGSHPEQISAHYRDGVLELRAKLDQPREPKEMKIDIG